MSAVTASVIVCAYTHERWDDLTAAIGSALAQRETSEVVVVVDHEESLLQRVRQHFPQVRAIPNSRRRGLAGARNSGVAASRGEILAFLDDDAVAEDGWLSSMLAVLADPQVAVVGGKALPRWPSGHAPAMLPPELLWVVGCTYHGQPEQRAEVRNIMGCSMLFRRAALEAIGGFDEATGRVGTIPLGGEETAACIRLRQMRPDSRIVFDPASIVRHRVTPQRATWAYLRRRSFGEGVSKAVLSRSLGAGDSLASESSYTVRILPRAVLRELLHGRPAGSAAILLSLAAAAAGYVYGLLAGTTAPEATTRERRSAWAR